MRCSTASNGPGRSPSAIRRAASTYEATHPEALSDFRQLNAAQIAAARAAYTETGAPGHHGFSVAGFTLLDISYDPTGDSDIRLADTSDPATAYTYAPTKRATAATSSSARPAARRERATTTGTPCCTSSGTRSGSSTATRATEHGALPAATDSHGILGDDLPLLRRVGRALRLQRALGPCADLHDVRHRGAAVPLRRRLHHQRGQHHLHLGPDAPAPPTSTASRADARGEPDLRDDLGRQRRRHLRPVELRGRTCISTLAPGRRLDLRRRAARLPRRRPQRRLRPRQRLQRAALRGRPALADRERDRRQRRRHASPAIRPTTRSPAAPARTGCSAASGTTSSTAASART